MDWLGRIFDRRDTWARMVLLDLSGLGYLFFGVQPRQPTPGQWALAILAFAAGLALFRWPLIGFLTQTGLLAIAFITIDDTTINQVGASWLLAELVVWARRNRTIGAAIALLAVAYVGLDIIWSPVPVQTGIFGLILPIGLPVLLGLVIRTSRELGLQAKKRALAEQQAVRADERSAIARELHDVLAHHVASMVLRVGVARHVLPSLDPRTAEVLDDVHRTGTAALADLRRLVAVLRDPSSARGDAALTAIDPGALPAALGAAVDTARHTGLTVDADIDPAVGTIDAVRGMAVLRLTQEALTNVAKHAGPSATVRLSVSLSSGSVSWEVADDGGDAAASDLPPGGGHGLEGMRERVELLGGSLTAGPAGTGWCVRTMLPATSEAAV
jgi:signal transduction histidine kinase